MPIVNLSDETVARMQKHAVALIDTYDTVIMRALDAMDVVAATNNAAASFRTQIAPTLPGLGDAGQPECLSVGADDIVNLTHTTLLSAVVGGVKVKLGDASWSGLMRYVLGAVRKSGKTWEQVRSLVDFQIRDGRYEERGFRYVAELGASLPPVPTPRLWSNLVKLLKEMRQPLEVEFRWHDNEKAFARGRRGRSSFRP